MSDPVYVLDYWLGEVGPEGWYRGGDALDTDIRLRFGDLWAAAHQGGLAHWCEGVVGTLAFLILTDQFPRNMFRGTAQSFATDGLALAAARGALVAGLDMQVPAPERQFFYMPFEHSEDPSDQAQAVALIAARMPEMPDLLLHARAHQEMIQRFGRFPLRNAALERENTPEEQAFLDAGGYMALVKSLSD